MEALRLVVYSVGVLALETLSTQGGEAFLKRRAIRIIRKRHDSK